MNEKALSEILEQHKLWLDTDFREGRCADLRGEHLCSHDLSGAILRRALMDRVQLQDAKLCGADLSHAQMRYTNLYRADLQKANVSDVSFEGAEMSECDLRNSLCYRTNFSHTLLRDSKLTELVGEHPSFVLANLQRANLCKATLGYANFYRAAMGGIRLTGAWLTHCTWTNAILTDAEDIPENVAAETRIVPEGDVIGWKRCIGGVIVKLLIPTEAERSNATGRKCRASFARVLDVLGADAGQSSWDYTFWYRRGQTVRCHRWDPERWNECSGGIHFYLTRAEAEAHR